MNRPWLLWWWPSWAELGEHWWDLSAWMNGWCNHAPWTARGETSGAQRHWRCQLRTDHLGHHRFKNYTWAEAALVRYNPQTLAHIDQWAASPYARKHMGASWWQRVREMHRDRAAVAAADRAKRHG